MTNSLYYGDNLDVLRRYVDDESVGVQRPEGRQSRLVPDSDPGVAELV